jgi:hypothetical protein
MTEAAVVEIADNGVLAQLLGANDYAWHRAIEMPDELIPLANCHEAPEFVAIWRGYCPPQFEAGRLPQDAVRFEGEGFGGAVWCESW